MNHKKTLSLMSLFIVLTAVFIGQGKVHEAKTENSLKPLNKNLIKEINKNIDQSNINPATTPPHNSPIQTNVIYDIKGDLSNLSIKQKENMDKSRETIVNNVRNKVYHNIFINGPTTEGNTVALTFDDGPDSKNTEKVINILRDHKIQATFFMIGNNVKQFPNVVKDAFQEGNLVLGHSYTHPQFTNLQSTSLVNELTLTDNILEQTIGKKPAVIRPPYGEVNNTVMETTNNKGYTTIIWSIDSLDWANPKNKENVVKNVVDNIRPGDIVLMHSTKDVTVEALPEIINNLKARGYRFQKLDEMLGLNGYKN